MITIATYISLIGFYILYSTSKRIEISTFKPIVLIQKHTKPAKILGLVLLVISMVLFMDHFGFGAGVLTAMITLMTVGCLIIILAPLKVIGFKKLAVLFPICLLLEFLSF